MAASGSKEMEIAIKIAGKVESSFKNALSAATKGLGTITEAVSASTAAAAAAVGALGVAAVNVGKEFETSMSQVAATMLLDKTVEEDAAKLATLEEAARKCGRETAFSAGEAAEALNQLAMAGYDATDAATALPTVLNLAGAGGLQLADSARYITASLAALGIEKTEDNFNHFADTLAITASKAKTDVSQLGDAITTLGGTGKGLKGGTEEIAAALGILADADITGSEGGTHLRNMILSLQNPRNADAAKAFEQLGIEAYTSTGKMRGLNEIFGDISKSMEGMTDQQKNDIMSTIFKQTDLAAANALLADCGDRFDELYEAAYYSSEGIGAAAEMYAIQMDNLEGDIDILKSGLSDLGISVYKDLNGPLREMTQLATSMVGELSEAYESGGMEGMVGAVGGCMVEVVNTIADYAPQVVSMGVNLISSFVQGIADNTGTLADTAAQVLTVFVGGLFNLVPQVLLAGIDIITQLAASITSQLPSLVSNGMQAITNFLNGIVQRLPGIVSIGIDIIKMLTDGIKNNLSQMIPTAMEALLSFSASIRENVGNLVDAGLEMVMILAQSLIDNIPVFIQTVPTIITNICGIINDNAPKLLSTGIILIGKLASGLIQAIPTLVANIPQIIQAVVSVFTAFNWISLGSKIVTTIGNGLSIMLPNLISKGTQLVNNIAQGITSGLPTIMQNGVQMISGLIQGIGAALPNILQSGLQIILSLVQGIVANLPTIIQSGMQLILSFASGLLSALPTILTAIGQIILSIGDAILSTNWLNVGMQIIKGLIDGILSTGKSLWSAIKSLFTGGEVDIPDTSSQSAAVVNSYASGINSNAETVTVAANSMTTNAFSSMDTSGATAAGIQVGTAFSTGLTDSMAEGGFDTAAFSENMITMGTTGAAALNTGFSTGLSGATIDTSALVVDASGLTTTLTTVGTQGITAIGTGMTENSQAVTQAATTLGNDVNTALDGGWNKANTSAQTAMQHLVTTVTDAARSAASAVKVAFENMTITIPKPKIPVISISTSSIPYGDSGIVSLPQFSVNWNATGGIFDQATILNTANNGLQGVGEAGPEAVLPLDTLWTEFKTILSDALQKYSGQSVIEALIAKLQNVGRGSGTNEPELAEAGGLKITYAPTYQLYGSATKEDAVEAEKLSQAEFNKLMKQWQKDNDRKKF